MSRYLLQQFISICVTMVVASVLVFSLVRLVPGDPVIAVIGVEENITPEVYAATAKRLGVNLPLHLQLVDYARRLVRLDLGTSFVNNRPVLDNIVEQFPFSIELGILSFLMALTISIPAGIVSAVNRNTWIDQSAMVVALSAVCIPSFLLGLLLIIFFAGRLGWFPTFGTGTAGDIPSLFSHAVLPAITLGASAAGLQARLVRSSVLEVMGQDYIRTARAKGLHERVVIFKHALRNALTPIITMLGMNLARLMIGTVVIETLFSRKGVGKLLVDAIYFRDYPQIQGTLLVFTLVMVVANTVTDIAYGIADPRIRFE